MRFQRADFDSIGVAQRHRGGGIGTFFGSIFKALLPVAKSAIGTGSKVITKAVTSTAGQNVIKAAKEIATETGKDIIKDVIAGENVAQSAQKHLTAAAKRAANQAKRTAVNAGLDIVQDTLQGKSLKGSAKRRVTEAVQRLVENEEEEDNGSDLESTVADILETTKKRSAKMKKGARRARTARRGRRRPARRAPRAKRGQGGGFLTALVRKAAGRKGKKMVKIKRKGAKQLGKQLVRQWL